MMRTAGFTAAFLLLLIGCSKNNSNNTTSGASLSATIGTSSFQGTTTNGAYSTSLDLIGVFSFNVAAKDTSAVQIVMAFPPPVNKPFTSDSLYLSYTTKGIEYDAYSLQGQLQLTISSLDSVNHKFAGTFSATGHNSTNYTDSIVITNGKFSTGYTINP